MVYIVYDHVMTIILIQGVEVAPFDSLYWCLLAYH